MQEIYNQNSISLFSKIWIILIVLLWSGGALIMPAILSEISPLWTAFLRFCFSLPFLFIYSIKNKINLKIKKKEFFKLLLLSVIFTLQVYLFHIGSVNSSGCRVALFIFVYPVIVTFLAPIFIKSEKFSIVKILGSLIAFIGVICALFSLHENANWAGSFKNDLVELTSAFLIALTIIFFKKLTLSMHYFKIFWWQIGFSSLLFLILALIFEEFFYYNTLSIKVCFYIVYQIVIVGVFCWISFQYFISKYNSSNVTIYFSLVPLFITFQDLFLNYSHYEFGIEFFLLFFASMMICYGIILVNMQQKPQIL